MTINIIIIVNSKNITRYVKRKVVKLILKRMFFLLELLQNAIIQYSINVYQTTNMPLDQ